MASSSAEVATQRELWDRIDEEIVQNMQRFDIPGMAFVLADENGTIYTKGYGVTEWGSAREINSTTRFQIGSISKVFTSLAVMQLQDQGLVELDAPVTAYLPWFATKDPTLSDLITIHDLLNHTSGLPGRLNTHDITSTSSEKIAAQIKHKLQSVQLAADPGTTYEYTNINYDLLQLVIEEVSGLNYPDYMRYHIYEPLGMHQTFFTRAAAGLDHNLATGHRYIWGHVRPFHENLAYATLGSAGLSTSAQDLGTYISFLLSGTSASGDPVIQADSLRRMHTAAIFDSSIGHGHGWEITANTIEKKGGLPGFSANLILVPGESYGFALLANSKQNITDETNFNIYRILKGDPPRHLAKSDYPAVSSINKSLLAISALLFLIIVLIWLPTWIRWLGKRTSCSLIRPTISAILFCFVLNGLILAGVLYYIYVHVPYASGAPSLHRLTTAPDTVNGLTLLSIFWIGLSISVACKSFVRQEIVTAPRS
ncbi:serine hydrolase domain-containing protein [Paenibacillus ihumii]|uniref:serine hydrolase domain-containing protein n=1 Tax=Paenibacillus ihumii TaxID=687436 RepID=UPI0009FB2909|nr:serine hydrolase domain-containing protein [Paenibacillus ihumii]